MIITKLHLLQVEREFFRRDAVELNQAFLGKGPKTFEPVHVDFSTRISLFMIDPEMPISAKHQRIIAPKFIGVDDRSARYCQKLCTGGN